ncbi:hypothetical protein [Frederiksenia canicola]
MAVCLNLRNGLTVNEEDTSHLRVAVCLNYFSQRKEDIVKDQPPTRGCVFKRARGHLGGVRRCQPPKSSWELNLMGRVEKLFPRSS